MRLCPMSYWIYCSILVQMASSLIDYAFRPNVYSLTVELTWLVV